MPPDGTAKIIHSGDKPTHGIRRTSWFGAFLAAAVLIACAVGIYYLSSDARREINALATANADSTQWALAQSEVELLALLSETRRNDLPETEQANAVRRRFDVFYSRTKIMRESAVLSGLRGDEMAKSALLEVSDLLDGLIPIIDGPDAALISALPDLSVQIEGVRPLVRKVSLAGVEYFARISDEQREKVTNALLRLGLLTFLLVAALSVVLLALMKSYRTATRDGREKAEAEQRMSVIVSTSLDAIIVADLEGRIIEFNEAAEKIFGYTRDEVLNQKLVDKIIPDKYREAHEAGMSRFIQTREKRVVGHGRVQLEGKHKSGQVFPVEFSISTAEGPNGTIFISYLRDISARVAEQEELVNARDKAVAGERAKANLVAVMSHEMRTPLNGIVGALELLRTTDLNKIQSQMTEVMGTSADMLLQHVNDVLDMSRLEAGMAEVTKRPFDPVAVTNALLKSLRMSARDHGNTLELSVLNPDFNLVLGDPGKLRQILTNLVGNAIKFTKHGKITVEIEPHLGDGQWELRVIDEGIGISEEDQKRVFEDFVTLDPSYTRAQEGTGLGLAIVRRLVEHLGGEISVESELGEGSVFCVRLPTNIIADADAKGSHKIADSAPQVINGNNGQDSLSILLVEDNAINRVVAQAMITKLGHHSIEAHNGREAVELAKMRKFDAILMDISMPDMDGIEATKAIIAEGGPNAGTPIFAVTAHAMPADIAGFTGAGMKDVLIKPIGMDRLAALLHGQTAVDPNEGAAIEYWDEAAKEELAQSLGETKYHELMDLFVNEMNDACRTTFAATEISDAAILKSEVHKLAGSASILGATKLRTLLHDIEQCIGEGELEAARNLLEVVPSCWLATREKMDQDGFSEIL